MQAGSAELAGCAVWRAPSEEQTPPECRCAVLFIRKGQGQVVWGFEQSALVRGVSAHGSIGIR